MREGFGTPAADGVVADVTVTVESTDALVTSLSAPEALTVPPTGHRPSGNDGSDNNGDDDNDSDADEDTSADERFGGADRLSLCDDVTNDYGFTEPLRFGDVVFDVAELAMDDVPNWRAGLDKSDIDLVAGPWLDRLVQIERLQHLQADSVEPRVAKTPRSARGRRAPTARPYSADCVQSTVRAQQPISGDDCCRAAYDAYSRAELNNGLVNGREIDTPPTAAAVVVPSLHFSRRAKVNISPITDRFPIAVCRPRTARRGFSAAADHQPRTIRTDLPAGPTTRAASRIGSARTRKCKSALKRPKTAKY